MPLWGKLNNKKPSAGVPIANTATVTVTAQNGDWIKTTTYAAVGGTRTKKEILVSGSTITGV